MGWNRRRTKHRCGDVYCGLKEEGLGNQDFTRMYGRRKRKYLSVSQ